MFEAPESAFLVPFDGSFRVADAATAPPENEKEHLKMRLKAAVRQLDDLQHRLLANNTYAVLLIFQGMDAAGKDSAIRAVMSGINPTGCQTFSFKRPTRVELDHDFLWRTSQALPERGRIGIFNRSQYEEVLVVRVHPEILRSQSLPHAPDGSTFWDERLQSIRDQEKHLARNGVVILKFWLNISADEQKNRLLRRLDEADRNWKFNPDDVAERRYRASYLQAYEEALNGTSRPWAPWYAIPADGKAFTRATVAELIVAALSGLGMKYPEPDINDLNRFAEARLELDAD
jgi:PPK2 family polyphosphate:nucleotide phosphotransferase